MGRCWVGVRVKKTATTVPYTIPWYSPRTTLHEEGGERSGAPFLLFSSSTSARALEMQKHATCVD
eukprot:scaffold482_cov266-Amphora_coffeaeformis.AAC.39